MVVTITLPDSYGYVILGNVVMPFFIGFYMSGRVMKARVDYDVKYPNLYATPGYHKLSDAFNRIQRGHQSMFESLTLMTAMGLLGGIKHPKAAAMAGVVYCLGNVLYLMGYADTSVDVDKARHTKGGPLKSLAFVVNAGLCISMAGTMNGWW